MPVGLGQREDRIRRGRITHETTDIRRGGTLDIQRIGWPEAFRRVLVALKPQQPARHLDIVAGETGLLERERDKARGVAVALHFHEASIRSYPRSRVSAQRRAFPRPVHGSETPASIVTLIVDNLSDERLPPLCRDEAGEFRRRPQKDRSIEERLCGVASVEVIAQQQQTVLYCGGRTIVLGSGTHCGRRKSSAVVRGLFRLPGS